MKIALVGATGLVGSVMLQVLEERGFGNCELIPAASSRSVGKTASGPCHFLCRQRSFVAICP